MNPALRLVWKFRSEVSAHFEYEYRNFLPGIANITYLYNINRNYNEIKLILTKHQTILKFLETGSLFPTSTFKLGNNELEIFQILIKK